MNKSEIAPKHFTFNVFGNEKKYLKGLYIVCIAFFGIFFAFNTSQVCYIYLFRHFKVK